MTLLTAFAAIASCRFASGAGPVPRQDDSGSRTMLPGGPESAIVGAMAIELPALPNDADALHALVAAERAINAALAAERDRLATRTTELETKNAELETIKVGLEAAKVRLEERNAKLEATNSRLEAIAAELKRALFGRRSERIDDDQLALALEELETAAAIVEAEAEKTEPELKTERTKKRRASRVQKLDHLPHEEVVIEPDSTACPCCGGALHQIGEDTSRRLDKVPAKLTVIVTRRPKYACRACEKTGADEVAGVIQAAAPARLVEGGLPTERLVADVVVSKYADHLPLYRQSQILARQGVSIERSTLAQWVGTAAAELAPLHDRLVTLLKGSSKLFCDETRCPVLDPGRGKTKTGFLWAIARDDRPWGGSDPPAVAYSYAPGRGGKHAEALLTGFAGILQVDGYSAYNRLSLPARPGGALTLAFCWSHVRRKFYAVYVGGNSPIATEALARIRQLYDIEADIRRLPPEMRQGLRQKRARPLLEALKPWLEASLEKVSKGSKLGEALRYALNHWDGLCRYLDDGRIEIDSNTVERSIRPIALTRKNALFAGHDMGAESWARLASLIETCKLNAVDPLAWMTQTLTRLVNRWPASRIDELMPWAHAAKPA